MAAKKSTDIRARVLRGIDKGTPYAATEREEIADRVIEELGAASDPELVRGAAPRLKDLKDRLQRLRCELLEDETEGDDRYYVLDKNVGKLVSGGQTLNDTYDWLEEKERERDAPARGSTEASMPADAVLGEIGAEGEIDKLKALKTRVAALRHKLVTNDGQRESDGVTPYTALYILDPATDKLVIVTAGDRESDEFEVEGWCKQREDRAVGPAKRRNVANEAAAGQLSKATAELLELMVCIGLNDRLEALGIRDSDGPEAAVRFIRETCTLTTESLVPSDESAKAEIRRQFEQAYALVRGAQSFITAEGDGHAIPIELLEMATDVLSDLEYINRLDLPAEPASERESGGAA